MYMSVILLVVHTCIIMWIALSRQLVDLHVPNTGAVRCFNFTPQMSKETFRTLTSVTRYI